jgi:hypothetical protein
MFSPLLTGKVKDVAGEVVINMWWIDIVVVALMALGVYGFITMIGFHTRRLISKTDRTAKDMYDQFADSPRRRHRGS